MHAPERALRAPTPLLLLLTAALSVLVAACDRQAVPVAVGNAVAVAPAQAGGEGEAAATVQPAGSVQVAKPAPPLPACTYADDPALNTGYDDWALTLLDTQFGLPSDYEPPDLVDVSTALASAAPGAYVAPEGIQLRAVLLDDLRAMFVAAEAAGVHLAVQSAYRSYSYQESTFAYWVEVDGLDVALRTSARPGHSEHQLGTTFDLKSRSGPEAWDLDDWATTPEGAWVAENAYRFGFVMSYPRGAESVSCYSYEPWHFRYVGVGAAAEIRESGLAPREYLWALTAGLDAD